MIRRTVVATVLLVSLGACTWVKLDPDGKAVRVAREGEDLSYCDPRGEIAVAVKHNVAFIQRNQIKVRDELETMARNEAPGLSADTIRSLDEPLYGEQRFAAFGCRNRSAAPATAPASRSAPGEAETFPVD